MCRSHNTTVSASRRPQCTAVLAQAAARSEGEAHVRGVAAVHRVTCAELRGDVEKSDHARASESVKSRLLQLIAELDTRPMSIHTLPIDILATCGSHG